MSGCMLGTDTRSKARLASFVYVRVYDVMEVKSDRVIIEQKRKVTAAVKAGDLVKA